MGHMLSHPVQSKNLQRFSNAHTRVGVAEMQGFRTNMEDAHHVTLSLAAHPHLAYIGMFDGHNGTQAAEFMAREMPVRLNDLPEPTDHTQLTQAVEKADADFCSDVNAQQHGSTALLVLIAEPAASSHGKRKLTVANLGDSRCLVIGADGAVKFTTVDHKPDDELESKRIYAAGGTVSASRVDGDLAMSRAIGDYTYKNVARCGPLAQKVIPTPDCTDVELEDSDIVLVCCDGLVERLTNAQVATFVVEQLKKQRASGGEIDPALIMAALLDFSLVRGSKDNMSAALFLQVDGTGYERDDEYRVGPYTEWSASRDFVDAYFADAVKHGYTNEQLLAMVHQQRDAAAKGGD